MRGTFLTFSRQLGLSDRQPAVRCTSKHATEGIAKDCGKSVTGWFKHIAPNWFSIQIAMSTPFLGDNTLKFGTRVL